MFSFFRSMRIRQNGSQNSCKRLNSFCCLMHDKLEINPLKPTDAKRFVFGGFPKVFCSSKINLETYDHFTELSSYFGSIIPRPSFFKTL